MKKQSDINHENIGLYQSQINEAHEVISQLQDVFSRIETLLQTNNGPSIKPSYISSKDFETVRNNSAEVPPNSNVDVSMLIRSLLNGASQSVWIQYLLKILSLSLSVSSSFNGVIILLALTYATLSALREDQLGIEDEKKLHLLKQQLDPIYATLLNLENKLSSSRDLKNHLDHEIKIPLKESNNQDSGLDFFTMTERMAKTSGLYFVLHKLFHKHRNFNLIICLAALQFTFYDLHLSKQKQQQVDTLSKDFLDKMENLIEMTEKMKQLLVKQENYEKFLIESNKAKEEYKKDIEIYKMEQLRKANEERKQEEIRENELKKLEKSYEEVFNKLKETWKENLKKLEQACPLPHVEKECIQSKLGLIRDEKDAMDSAAPVLRPAWLAGVIGAGCGWIIGISISILCAAPTLGLSLVAPIVGALIGGIVSYCLASRKAHSENSHTMFYKKETSISGQIISTTAATSFSLHHAAGR